VEQFGKEGHKRSYKLVFYIYINNLKTFIKQKKEKKKTKEGTKTKQNNHFFDKI